MGSRGERGEVVERQVVVLRESSSTQPAEQRESSRQGLCDGWKFRVDSPKLVEGRKRAVVLLVKEHERWWW